MVRLRLISEAMVGVTFALAPAWLRLLAQLRAPQEVCDRVLIKCALSFLPRKASSLSRLLSRPQI